MEVRAWVLGASGFRASLCGGLAPGPRSCMRSTTCIAVVRFRLVQARPGSSQHCRCPCRPTLKHLWISGAASAFDFAVAELRMPRTSVMFLGQPCRALHFHKPVCLRCPSRDYVLLGQQHRSFLSGAGRYKSLRLCRSRSHSNVV